MEEAVNALAIPLDVDMVCVRTNKTVKTKIPTNKYIRELLWSTHKTIWCLFSFSLNVVKRSRFSRIDFGSNFCVFSFMSLLFRSIKSFKICCRNGKWIFYAKFANKKQNKTKTTNHSIYFFFINFLIIVLFVWNVMNKNSFAICHG